MPIIVRDVNWGRSPLAALQALPTSDGMLRPLNRWQDRDEAWRLVSQAIEEAAGALETRGIIVLERGRFRVRDRSVLRYYARTIEHLLVTTGRTH